MGDAIAQPKWLDEIRAYAPELLLATPLSAVGAQKLVHENLVRRGFDPGVPWWREIWDFDYWDPHRWRWAGHPVVELGLAAPHGGDAPKLLSLVGRDPDRNPYFVSLESPRLVVSLACCNQLWVLERHLADLGFRFVGHCQVYREWSRMSKRSVGAERGQHGEPWPRERSRFVQVRPCSKGEAKFPKRRDEILGSGQAASFEARTRGGRVWPIALVGPDA